MIPPPFTPVIWVSKSLPLFILLFKLNLRIREGGDIRLFITLVQSFIVRFPIRWLNNFGGYSEFDWLIH